jgi:hypothetical protein
MVECVADPVVVAAAHGGATLQELQRRTVQ